eukprot:CAMPEP_0115828262 /NCGR_PEP_ID=MMETSP0287-20121206/480_1 /TAXON_ID=412157 /ORGANISM="Chrysochromulina rotalis, Strain UIO044" /LENGTH=295 /DNA_ID=CAMNT_0003281467 /DNA_START=25 /DNA_END=912 /DNA_ORIENTATION=-
MSRPLQAPTPFADLLHKFFCGCFLAGSAAGKFASTPAPSRRVHMPSLIHASLPMDSTRPRTILVGDLHGCLDELEALLRECAHDPCTDRVVLTGDLVNKGPKSAECVREARIRGYFAVRGNHDDAALFAWERRERERLEGGIPSSDHKYAYTDSFDSADVAFLRELPYTLRLDGQGMLVVHAGLVPGVSLAEQHPAYLYTMRNLVKRSGSWEARVQPNEGVPWATEWIPDEEALPNVRHVVFGHDAKRGLQQAEHATGLDTGCCYGKQLTALLLPEWRIVSVPAARMYSKPKDLE